MQLLYKDFNSEIILENEIVLLKPLVKEDLRFLESFSIQEPELWKYSLIPANGIKKFKELYCSRFRRKRT